jgi:hypothetical protein
VTLTAMMRKNGGKPPPRFVGDKHDPAFPRWTLGAAVAQLRLYLPAYGRKMLRVCLALLRDEREALWAVRVLDAWQDANPDEHAFATFIVAHKKWRCSSHSYPIGFDGADADEARIAAARQLVDLYPNLATVYRFY